MSALNISMRPSVFDPRFLFQMNKNSLSGITDLSIDDSLKTGNSYFQTKENYAKSLLITLQQSKFQMRFLGLLI